MAGGEIRSDDSAAYGPTAVEFARQFTTHKAILSMGSIHAKQGCLDFDLAEAEFKRAVLPQAEQVIVVVDHTKFNRPGTIKVADFRDVDKIVTDRMPSDDILEKVGNNKILIAT